MNESDLKILELSPTDLIDLSDEQKEAKIKVQYRRMALRFHPDKNKNDPQASEHFQKINAAYTALRRSNTECHSEIHTFSNHQEIIIPDTAFSLLLEENIEAAFDALNHQFRMLHSEQEKKEFRDYYGRFLNLAYSLEKKRTSLQANRGKYFYEHINAPLNSRVTYEWRNLIIRLFAEEYLDDFKYRHALATGDFTDILATRKLLSPIKVIVALLNTINLSICISAGYLLATFIQKLVQDFSGEFNKERGERNILKCAMIAVQMLVFPLIIGLCVYFAPSLMMFGFSLPFISNFLEFLASPINKIVRPIAEYSRISPFILTAAFLAIGAAGIYSSMHLIILGNSAAIFLIYLTNAIYYYTNYILLKFLFNLYQQSPAAGMFMVFLMSISFLINFVSPLPTLYDTPKTSEILLMLMNNLSIASLLYLANEKLINPSVYAAEIMQNLPLPKEPVPEHIQEATNLVSKKATLSHQLFNTPKDTEFLLQEERTFSQQTASFFGAVIHKTTPYKNFPIPQIC